MSSCTIFSRTSSRESVSVITTLKIISLSTSVVVLNTIEFNPFWIFEGVPVKFTEEILVHDVYPVSLVNPVVVNKLKVVANVVLVDNETL